MCGRIIHVPVLTAKHASGPAASLTRFVTKLMVVTIGIGSSAVSGGLFFRNRRHGDETGDGVSAEAANFIPRSFQTGKTGGWRLYKQRPL